MQDPSSPCARARVRVSNHASEMSITRLKLVYTLSLLWLVSRAGASTTLNQDQKLLASDAASNDAFGGAVSLSGDYALVGSPYDDRSGLTNVGSAYVYLRSGSSWAQQQRLTPSDGAQHDSFGNTVSLDGDYALIGAGGHGLSGAAYIFKRSGTTWTQQQKLTASDSSKVSYFGKQAVALYGEYAVVSDHYAGEYGDQKGAAWVFKRSGSSWTQQQKLTASDGAHEDRFGRSVSLFSDYAIIGAEQENNGRGAAYVFKRSGSSWTQQQKLTASDGGSNNFFGDSVSISEDYALVGSPNNFEGIRKGAAYIFTRTGSSWTQQQKLVASDGENYKYFGESVSLSADLALVGTMYHEKAYVFERSGSSWTEKYKLSATDNTYGDGFGNARSLCISGNDVIIGSDSSATGSAYIFTIPSSSPPPPPPPQTEADTDTTPSPTTDTTPSPTTDTTSSSPPSPPPSPSPGSLTSPKFLTLIASALTVILANP